MPLKDMPWPETRSVLRLAAPIALTQIGMVLYGTVNMLFVGRLGAGAIAAVGLMSVTAPLVAAIVLGNVANAFLDAARGRLAEVDSRFHGWHRRLFLDMFTLGFPGGMQMLVEVAIFSLVTALIGRLGAQVLAAHQLTLNLASATFQIFDGAQAVLSGALRGLRETRRPLLINLIGHWLIGLPIGAGLAVVATLLWREWRLQTGRLMSV